LRSKIILVSLFSFLLLAVLFAGCSSNKGQGGDNSQVNQADRDSGFAQGYDDGYQKGYADGRQGVNDAAPGDMPQGSAEFMAGYQDGFGKGYAAGHGKGEAEATQSGTGGNQEEADKAAVESAMANFVSNNSVPGLQFRIENIVIHGNQAAGIAVCTSERLENVLVIMEKDASGWHGVDFGTGIEPPSWYSY
jgi:hypothetical protein